MLTSTTRWVLAHRRIVTGFWVLVTLVGVVTINSSTHRFTQSFSVPGREGFETNSRILHVYGNGGNYPPLVPVISLPSGKTVNSPGVRAGLLGVESTLRRALPGTRTASYADTGNRAFVSRDGRTTFVLAYPPPQSLSFGSNAAAAKIAARALSGATVAGTPVLLTGYDALNQQGSGGAGPGVLLEAMLGGLGALAVLAFVFASLLAFVPILMAIVSIMTTFLVLGALASVTQVSFIVEFLVALIGLGWRSTTRCSSSSAGARSGRTA